MAFSVKVDKSARGRAPPHLRGRELGLFYKNMRHQRNSNELTKFFGRVILPTNFIQQIKSHLKEEEEENLCRKINLNFEEHFRDIISSSFEDSLRVKSLQNNANEPFGYFKPEHYKKRVLTEEQLRLPVFKHSQEILNAVESNNIVLISGDTGCGKTTQIPQIILDNQIERGYGSICHIICTQPRRISAISVAERVADERGEKLGNSVGFQIRLENSLPRPCASILYCTTGVLLRRLESDPLLAKVSHIILDEVHERNIESDILIGLVKSIIQYNKKLKVILMSATFGINEFAKHFEQCSIIKIEGVSYPVEVKYLEDVLQDTLFFEFPGPKSFLNGKPKHFIHSKFAKNKVIEEDAFANFISPYARCLGRHYHPKVIQAIQNPNSEEINFDLLKCLVDHIDNNLSPGGILIFLPGYEKISKFHEMLISSPRNSRMRIYALHSQLPTLEQKGVFERPPTGIRKVILATNIAETSITINDIVYVINTGKMKCTDYNAERNYSILEEKWNTLAHSKQRQGRAGRCQPGICYHLYTRAREYTFENYPSPEILRSRLEPIILNLKMMKIHNVKEFLSTLISVPKEEVIDRGIKLLKRLNALNADESISPLGLQLAKLPLDPQIGKMILMSAIFQCVDPITTIAATLSYKDPFYRPIGKEKEVDQAKQEFAETTQSDHLTYVNVIRDFRRFKNNRKFTYDNFLSSSTLNQIESMKKQLCDLLYASGFINHSSPTNAISNSNSNCDNLLRGIVAGGLYPNVAVIQNIKQVKNKVKKRMKIITPEDGNKVKIHPSSVNSEANSFESKFLVYFNLQKSTDIFLYDTTTVHPISLLLFGDQFTIKQDIVDEEKWYLSISNETFIFESNKKTAKLISKLRNRFDVLFRDLALNPSAISDVSAKNNSLIKALKMILTYEYHNDYHGDEA